MSTNKAENELITIADAKIESIKDEIDRLSGELSEWQKARRKLSAIDDETTIEKAKSIANEIAPPSASTNSSKAQTERQERARAELAVKIDKYLDSVGGSASVKDISKNIGLGEPATSSNLKKLGYTQICKGRYAKWGKRKHKTQP